MLLLVGLNCHCCLDCRMLVIASRIGLHYLSSSAVGVQDSTTCVCFMFSCFGRVTHPAAVVSAVILLGAGWAVPYYVPLPAYNLRKGGSFSAVLEGRASCLCCACSASSAVPHTCMWCLHAHLSASICSVALLAREALFEMAYQRFSLV